MWWHWLQIVPGDLHFASDRVPETHLSSYKPILLTLLDQCLARRMDLVTRPLDLGFLMLSVGEWADADGGSLEDGEILGASPGFLASIHDGDTRGVVVVAVSEVVGERCFGLVDGGSVAGCEEARILRGSTGVEEENEAKEGREKEGNFMHF